MTPSERHLWQALRRRQHGLRFRRQVLLGRFIADFCGPAKKLVVETDGDTHADPAKDHARYAWMIDRVLRFTIRDVMGNMKDVLLTIQAACCAPLLLGPHPRGEGDQA
jgi:very-short-patch-repair endonuclease